MKEYFNNPEIKRSSIACGVIMISFILINWFILQHNYSVLKSNYINVLGAVTEKVVEKNPELEKEIVPLMTKPLDNDKAKKGAELIKQYGLSDKLENDYFPYVNATISKIQFSLIFTTFILSLILLCFNYNQHVYYYKNIKKFNKAAKKIVEGNYDLKLSDEKEGDLSKLVISFNSMGDVIRNNINELKKEKNFLINLLSDISHQLKTPLSSMILYNDIMLNKELTKEQRNTFLVSNQGQLERMKWMILNLLKLARIDAKAVELEMERQSLNETIEECMEILESKALESEVKVIYIEKETIYFNHDRLWLQEALINVIKNGIEHSARNGEVTIEAEENPAFIRITISDTGEGIEEEDLVNIFKRFYKTKNSKKSDSIGIGLALAKAIVERHSGFIEVNSKINNGTSFVITFLKY